MEYNDSMKEKNRLLYTNRKKSQIIHKYYIYGKRDSRSQDIETCEV